MNTEVLDGHGGCLLNCCTFLHSFGGISGTFFLGDVPLFQIPHARCVSVVFGRDAASAAAGGRWATPRSSAPTPGWGGEEAGPAPQAPSTARDTRRELPLAS